MQAQHVTALEQLVADLRADKVTIQHCKTHFLIFDFSKAALERQIEMHVTSALRGDRLEEKRIEDIISKYVCLKLIDAPPNSSLKKGTEQKKKG